MSVSQRGYGTDKGQASASASNGVGLSVLMRVETSLMGMWHMMTESRTSTPFSRVLALALLLFDFLTTASLAVHEDSLLRPYLRVTVHDLLPSGDKAIFLAVYIIVQAVVWFALLDGAFVAWSFAIGRFRALWPAHVLRTIIGIIGTALYNPFLEVLVLPLRCSELAYYWSPTSSTGSRLLHARGLSGSDTAARLSYDPSGLTCPPGASFDEMSMVQITLTCISLISITCFVPFALSTQLVYIDADPATEAWDGMSNGRENVLDSAVRTALVFLTFFVKSLDPLAHAVVFVVLMVPLTHRLIVTLPFYRPWHNMLRAGLYAITTWLSIESLALACMRKYHALDDFVHSSAVGFIAALPFVTLAIIMLPLVKYQSMRRGLVRVLHAIDEIDRNAELADARKAGDKDMEEEVLAEDVSPQALLPSFGGNLVRTMSVVLQMAGLGAHFGSRHFKINPISAPPMPMLGPSAASASAGSSGDVDGKEPLRPVRSARRLSAVMKDTTGEELVCVVGSKTRDTAEASRRFGGRPEAVEAMAILVLQTNWAPFQISAKQHSANLALGLFTRRAISQAERVFEHGVLAFPADPGVRVAYARFLSTFAQDSMRAIGMLQTVNKCAPRLEDRFALFSFGRSLDQKRQSSDLGEGDMDAVGIIAFRQTQSQALRHHASSVANILQLWKMIDGKQAAASLGAGAARHDAQSGNRRNATGVTAAQLTEQIAKIVAARGRAQGDYDKLLARYPNAVLLLRSYQAFVADVLNDPGWAAVISSRIEGLIAGEGRDDDGGGDRKSAYQGTVLTKMTGEGGSVGGRSGMSWNRKAGAGGDQRMGNQGSRSVADMRWKMQAGLVLLAVLAAIIFAVTRTTLDDFSRLIGVIFDAGSRRYKIVAGGFYTRTLVLAAGVIEKSGYDMSVMCSPTLSCLDKFNDARTRTLEAMKDMQYINSHLYDPSDSVKLFPAVRRLYDTEDKYSCNQVSLGPPAVNMTVKYGLQGLLVKFAGNCVAAAQMPIARLAKCANFYCDDPVIWRFIQDSWYIALTGANEASDEYVKYAFTLSDQFKGISFGLLGIVSCVLLSLWACVFWPAAMSVQRTNAGVVSIADAIPREAVRVLVKRYGRIEQQLGTLSEQVSGNAKEDDVESDRGLDSVRGSLSSDNDEDGDDDSIQQQKESKRRKPFQVDNGPAVSAKAQEREKPAEKEKNPLLGNDRERSRATSAPPSSSVYPIKAATTTTIPPLRPRQSTSTTGATALPASAQSLNSTTTTTTSGAAHSMTAQLPEITKFASSTAPASVASRTDTEGKDRNEEADCGRVLDSVGSAVVENIDSGIGNELDAEGTARLERHTLPAATTASAVRVGMPPTHPSSRSTAKMHAITSHSSLAPVLEDSPLSEGRASKTEADGEGVAGQSLMLSEESPMGQDKRMLSARAAGRDSSRRGGESRNSRNSRHTSRSLGAISRGRVSRYGDRSPMGADVSDSFGKLVNTRSSAQMIVETGITTGLTDYHELRRAGASAANVLDQMLNEQKDFKRQLTAARIETAELKRSVDADASFAPKHSPVPAKTVPSAIVEGNSEPSDPETSAFSPTPVNQATVPLLASMDFGTDALAPAKPRPMPPSHARRISKAGDAPSSALKGMGEASAKAGSATKASEMKESNVSKKHGRNEHSKRNLGDERISVSEELGTAGSSMAGTDQGWDADMGLDRISSGMMDLVNKGMAIVVETFVSFGVVLGVGKSTIALSPLLRTLSSRVGLALVVLLTLQSLAAALNYKEVQTASFTAAAINVAGYRRELAITSAFQARELLCGPDIIGTYALAVDLMRDYTDALSRYHRALLLGDESLNLRPTRGTDPAQDRLLANPDGAAFVQQPLSATKDQVTLTSGHSNITEEELLTASVARMGLDYLVTRYVDASNSFLARFEPWLTSVNDARAEIVMQRYGIDLAVSSEEEKAFLNPDDGIDYRKSVPGHNLTLIMQDPAMRELETMAFKLLDKKLETSVSLYLAQVDRQAATSTIIQITVFALNIAILVALQYGVFAAQFANLAAEAQRTQELLRLIPGPVLDTTPKLRAFLNAGSKNV